MRRLAIWIHGGVGGGFFSQGQPAIHELISGMSKHFEIDVYSMLPPNNDYRPASFRLYYPASGVHGRLLRWMFLVSKFFFNSIRKPYQLLYGFWGYPAGVIAVILGKLSRKPSLIHLQGGDAASIPDLKYGVFYSRIRGALCRFAYARSSALIVLTEFQAACLRENKVFRQPYVIPFGVDTNLFSFKAERFDQPFLRFLNVGNQTPVKGQETMLKVFSKIARQVPSRLVVVGSDHYEGYLKRCCVAMEIDDKVEFRGPEPRCAMPRLYENADILLHTARHEGQGLIVAEAAACGTLLAGTRVGMLSDMGDECAIVVSQDQVEFLADRILAVLKAPQKIKELRLSAFRWVHKKDATYTEGKIMQIVNELTTSCRDEYKCSVFPDQVERQGSGNCQQDQAGKADLLSHL